MPDMRSHHTHIKSTSLLANTLMRIEAQAQNASEVIVLQDGKAIEAISSNICIVKDNTVYTPPISPRLVGGVTRETILKLCRDNQIAYAEQDCPTSLLFSADEIWVTGSTKEIVPVIQLNDQPVGTGHAGPIWNRMIRAYKAYEQACLGITLPL
jgi:D-alanine transaminase